MFPMVSSVADLLAGSARVAERAALLGVAVPPTGVMIETPSAALLAGHLARHAAFFSIGTNDLTQYVTASDRTHGALGGYQDAANPAVLQLVERTCRAGEANGIPTAVCGEAASDPVTLTVFLGLGVDELSIASTRIDRVRWLVDQLDPVAVRRVAREALELPDADAVRELVTPLLP
jgi:phosphoenolpyruvate-protein kinase (PTS system EI component)